MLHARKKNRDGVDSALTGAVMVAVKVDRADMTGGPVVLAATRIR